MANNGLVADEIRARNVRGALLKEKESKLSFPNISLFSDDPVDKGNFIHSCVARRQDTHEELDDIQTERARYLLNIDDALIELLR